MSGAGPRLETARLVLSPLAPADTERLHRHWTHPEVRRFLWDDVVIEPARVEAVVGASAAGFAGPGFGLFVVRARADGAFVGCCGLREVEGGTEVELVYSLEPSRWGRGLATEAARAVLADGFGRVGLARIAGRVDTPNRPSARVLERLGMRALGERALEGRPTLHYALDAPPARAGARGG